MLQRCAHWKEQRKDPVGPGDNTETTEDKPTLGGHFRIQLSNTAIPGKGAVAGAAFLVEDFSGIPRRTTSC